MDMDSPQGELQSQLAHLQVSTGSAINSSWVGVIDVLQSLLPQYPVEYITKLRGDVFKTAARTMLIGPAVYVRGGYHLYSFEPSRDRNGSPIRNKRNQSLFTIRHVRAGRVLASYANSRVPESFETYPAGVNDRASPYISQEIERAIEYATAEFVDYELDASQCVVCYRLLTPDGNQWWTKSVSYSLTAARLFATGPYEPPVISKLDANKLRELTRLHTVELDLFHDRIVSSNCRECGGGIVGNRCTACNQQFNGYYNWDYPLPLHICAKITEGPGPTMVTDPRIALRKAYTDWLDLPRIQPPAPVAADCKRQIIIN